MDYKILRAKRKTVGIYIQKDGSVEVRCPKGISAADIEAVVRSKMGWIEEKSAQKRRDLELKNAFELDGETPLLLFGKDYPLVFTRKGSAGFDGERFVVPAEAEDKKAAVVRIYKKIAKRVLGEKVRRFAKLMGCEPSGLKINSAKGRWGSCGAKNTLNFTWRLIMAPESAVDYVVIHELAHTKEHNHGQRFWELVAAYMPDYRREKEHLKRLGERLARENWD